MSDDRDSFPMVKWLVALRSMPMDGSTRNVSIREFQCGGYYEALDRVLRHAERTNTEVLWFKEKRACDEPLAYSAQLPLEYFCTYCNIEHSTEYSIPCQELDCNSVLCSRKCYEQHMALKHTNSGNHNGRSSG